MNDFIATALAAAILASSNAAAPTGGSGPGLQGRWVADGLSCRGSEGVMEVSRKGFLLTETNCRFGARAPEGFSSVAGPMACSAEGEGFSSRVAMVSEGNRAMVSFDGARPMSFRRC